MRQILTQRGQSTLEMILLMFVFITFAGMIAKGFRKGEWVANMVTGPWTQLTGMIENGTWGPAQKTRANHPGYLKRHISILGEREGGG